MSREEVIVSNNILDEAVKFVESKYFQNKIEGFYKDYCWSFKDLSNSKCPEDEEMSFEYTHIFQKYQILIDSLFEEFSADHNISVNEIYKCCRDAVDGKFTALFEEHEHKWFVDMVMSWSNFDLFISTICHHYKKEDEKVETKSYK